MEQELGTLFEAQKIESQIIENEQKRLSAPRQLKAIEAELAEILGKIEKEREIIEELEKERHKKEKELEVDKDKVKKLETKLYDVKTNKEYQALLKEIEAVRETNDRTEEDVLVLMDKIEDLRKDLEASAAMLKKREEETQTERVQIEKAMRSTDEVIAKLTVERDNLLSVVSDNLRSIYGVLRERRGGVAVTNVKNGVCMGCHMNIPPQLFIEVTKNRQLIQCPSCNRILFFMEND